jgi:hypothetical protein
MVMHDKKNYKKKNIHSENNTQVAKQKQVKEKKLVQLLHKIWTNIKVLRIAATLGFFGTLITIGAFSNEFVRNYKAKNALEYVKANVQIVVNIDLIGKDKKEWKEKLDYLSDFPKYKDDYNFYMALYYNNIDNSLNGGYTAVDKYLNKINESSDYFPRTCIIKTSNIDRYVKSTIAIKLINNFLERIELTGVYFPEYYISKTNLLLHERNFAKIDTLYSEFIETYPNHSFFEQMNVTSGMAILDIEKIKKILSVDYYIKYFILKFNKKSHYTKVATDYFIKILQFDQNQFKGIVSGFLLFNIFPPCCTEAVFLNQLHTTNIDTLANVERIGVNRLLNKLKSTN